MIADLDRERYYLGNLALIEENTFANPKLTQVVNKLSNLGNSVVVLANSDQSKLAILALKIVFAQKQKSH